MYKSIKKYTFWLLALGGTMCITFHIYKTPFAVDLHKRPIATVASMHELERLAKTLVLQNKDKKLLAAFDLDETLLHPANKTGRGGDFWLQARINNAMKKSNLTWQQAWDTMLPLFFEIQQDPHFKMQLVEGAATKNTVEWIQHHFDKVIGLTARSLPIENDTIRLLEQAGISFVHSGRFTCLPTQEQLFVFDGIPGGFKHGIFFAGSGNKGDALLKLFERCNYMPDIVLFVDDKAKNVRDVEDALSKHNIVCVGLRYTYLDQVRDTYKLPDAWL